MASGAFTRTAALLSQRPQPHALTSDHRDHVCAPSLDKTGQLLPVSAARVDNRRSGNVAPSGGSNGYRRSRGSVDSGLGSARPVLRRASAASRSVRSAYAGWLSGSAGRIRGRTVRHRSSRRRAVRWNPRDSSRRYVTQADPAIGRGRPRSCGDWPGTRHRRGYSFGARHRRCRGVHSEGGVDPDPLGTVSACRRSGVTRILGTHRVTARCQAGGTCR
jgi:hypothetical protein